MVILPAIQTFIFCSAVGLNFKNMPVAIKNDEVNLFDCKNYSNINECIFDDYNNQTLSCIVMNYLSSHNYALVSTYLIKIAVFN